MNKFSNIIQFRLIIVLHSMHNSFIILISLLQKKNGIIKFAHYEIESSFESATVTVQIQCSLVMQEF